ncbi:Glyoxalase/Bleomycin resistance protein/Dihydroxybiphenyl dioxygenase [Hyaloraphidium curvatum]|nr:Glyoxalase/Bleomycin resistance protein/Dihydroxybiphenyl dioxygenase [Hyaloraphidium curvatum]
MDRAVSFYSSLGFRKTELVAPSGASIAPHLGIDVRALKACIMLPAAADGPMLDLVEFVDPPAGEGPYPHAGHIGASRVCLETWDLDAAMGLLKKEGAKFAGPDVTYATPLGEHKRTAMFFDPEGTMLQFIAPVDAQRADGRARRFYHLNLNVAEMDRSVEFYRALGFEVLGDIEVENEALGVPMGIKARKLRAAFLRIRGDDGGMILDLVRFAPPWITEPYRQANSLGISRFALWAPDIGRALEVAEGAGGRTVADPFRFPGPGGQLTDTVMVRDPDGIFVQFFAAASDA